MASSAKLFAVYKTRKKVVGVVSAAQLRQLARAGAESSLERAVLAGQGHRLLAEADSLSLSHHLPALIAKCEALHAAVEKGSLLELQELLERDYNRKKYVNCRDEAGVGLLHKAIFYDYMDIAEYLVNNYPQLVHAKDSEGRTPLHYVAVCRDEAGAAGLLEAAGAARGARDAAGRTPAHYRGHARTLLALPPPRHHEDMARENKNPPGLVIKRHNIRIWCHDCDMARLQRVVWEGHGSRLLSEVSSQPVVRKFLEAVPYIMNTIRDIHQAVIDNDLEGLMKHAGDPVPPQALSCRDGNYMTPMHKAAGLGHSSIMKYIAERYPQGVNDIDNDGRTPLHYAAAVKDEQHTFNTLIDLGADESILDSKNKTPAYYINRPQEIDKNLFKALPDAPRTPSSAYPASWDWKLLDNYVIAELNKKSKKRNLRASNENISNISSKNYTNTISESTENRNGVMKTSSTHEFIKDLPELEESNKPSEQIDEDAEKPQINEINRETDNIEETKEDEINESQEEPNEVNTVEENNESNDTENIKEEEIIENTENKHDENKNDDTEEDKNVSNSNDEELKSEEEAPETGEINTEVSHDDDRDNKSEQEKEEKQENEAENVEKPQDNEAETEETLQKNEEVDNNDSQNNDIDKHAAEIDGENNTNQNKDHHDDSNVAEIKDDAQEDHNDEGEEEEEPKTTNQHINGLQNEEDIQTENNNLQKRSDSGKDKANSEMHDSSATEGNDINNERNIEDDDDVQVQGDSQSEYSDFNHKSTAEISNTGSANLGSVSNGRNTQESLIEGIIDGEAEQDSQDASITQRNGSVQGEVLIVDNEIDPEVTELINNANMEMLATLVLNGEGSRLIGRQSGNSELQGFLENVPSYMQKINKVHVAARDGNIKDLQSALDRRKFAIARDPISPNGATPLHVATVFGKTNVMKYLGGRFPETLSAVDFEGRTALHYAAVLPDNGHYYNLLQQLGANSKDLDDNGRSAEDYYTNPLLLPFNQLLSDFGISEEAAQTMFSDKVPNDRVSSRRDLDAVESLDTLDRCYRLLASARSTRTPLSASSNRGIPPLVLGPTNDDEHMDIPIFKTEEGRYLAKSLGDPLIKGLTEVANVKPKDPVAFLASFLHNFPENEKPRIETQQSNLIIAHEGPEVENMQAPIPVETTSRLPRSATRTATRSHRPIDVVAVDPQPAPSPDAPETAFSSAKRDEHGQSMLHFAAARTHARNALFQLLQETDVSLGYRDELYRTARDVSTQANVPENTVEIDRYVLHLAARGNKDKINELIMEGYDHILGVVDDEGVTITDIVTQRGDNEMINLLASIPAFEESRDILHSAVRRGDLSAVKSALSGTDDGKLVRSQNTFSRTALHIAVLAQHEDIVAYLAETYPPLLRLGDNLERTPLHYAMGVEKVESLSRVLIRAGAKRVLKDLKGRQPSYYFMNKSDILRLQEEEDIY